MSRVVVKKSFFQRKDDFHFTHFGNNVKIFIFNVVLLYNRVLKNCFLIWANNLKIRVRVFFSNVLKGPLLCAMFFMIIIIIVIISFGLQLNWSLENSIFSPLLTTFCESRNLLDLVAHVWKGTAVQEGGLGWAVGATERSLSDITTSICLQSCARTPVWKAERGIIQNMRPLIPLGFFFHLLM